MLVDPIIHPVDPIIYTEGAGIDITNNVISSTLVEGTGIDITNSVISTSLVAGTGIDITGATISLNQSTIAVMDGAVQETTRNQPNGFAGLDAQSTINAIVAVQVMTRNECNATVPAPGVLVVLSDTKDIRFGDGASAGGHSSSPSSQAMLYISCVGTTPTQNATQLYALYQYAKTMTPYGFPLSANNRVAIMMSSGTYEINSTSAPSGFTLDAPYIDLIGYSQKECRIVCNGPQFTIHETNIDHALRNITFVKGSANPTNFNILWRFTDVPFTFWHENLSFENAAATDTVMTFNRNVAYLTSTMNGYARNVKTIATRLYSGGANQPPTNNSHTINATFEGCEGGNNFIGTTASATRHLFQGTLRRCRYTGTGSLHMEYGDKARVIGCEWNREMTYVRSGAKIAFTTFTPVAGVASITGIVGSVQNVYMAHNILSLTGSANITNTAAATHALAMNVLSDTIVAATVEADE